MKARFEIDTQGMRELQEGREPWQLVKELVSNSWDEAIHHCEVTVTNLEPRKTKIVCYDDGAGFYDITDAWTLMKTTNKRSNPNVRGRFNIGEKEIISVAKEAKIMTSGKIIIFPNSGGRLVKTAPTSTNGTTVQCIMPWGNRQADSVVANLRKLLPPENITYVVNGIAVAYQKPYKVLPATLDTILQERPNEPMRPTRRQTTIEIYKPTEKPTLYEMGIPVQEITCQYSVNVLQKIPLPPNRDTVRDSYLQDIYKTVLEATVDEVSDPSATWVRQAVEDPDISPIAVKKTMEKRFGDKVVLWSKDQWANEKALDAGYEIIHGRTLSEAERNAFGQVGLQHSNDTFKPSFGESTQYDPTLAMQKVAKYAKMLHQELIGTSCTIQFFSMNNCANLAQYGNGCLSFCVTNLGKAWFETINPAVTSLILHEISHTSGDQHNNEWQKNFERLAGKAVHLALEKPELFKEFI
jgi:hypothetical protein